MCGTIFEDFADRKTMGPGEGVVREAAGGGEEQMAE